MHKSKLRLLIIGLCLFSCNTQADWAQDILKAMSLDEKIGQLFFIAVQSNPDNTRTKETFHKEFAGFNLVHDHDLAYAQYMIQEYHVGGMLLISTGYPFILRNALNQLQKLSKLPLLVAIDAEWGLNQLIHETISFPKNMSLGAIQHESTLFEMGEEIARQCRMLGIHINLAPVVDINTNPLNPVIGNRSFGDDMHNVTNKALIFIRGLQENGVLACAKHFPGHGDVDQDSHKCLPLLTHSRARLDAVELYPFKECIKHKVAAIMPAHLHIPALDSRKNIPSSLSRAVVHDLLQTELGFDGLVISDSLVMHGATDYCMQDGDVELNALLAGHDILLWPKDVAKAHAKIKKAIEEKIITENEIDHHVLKILRAKELVDLHRNRYINENRTYNDLNTAYGFVLKKQLYDQAVTLVKNNNNALPLQRTQNPIALVQIGCKPINTFAQLLHNNLNIEIKYLPPTVNKKDMQAVIEQLKKYQTIIFGIFGIHRLPQNNFGIAAEAIDLIRACSTQTKTIVALFGTPYSIKLFGDKSAILVAYEDDVYAQQTTAEIICGARVAVGKLPIKISLQQKELSGVAETIPSMSKNGGNAST